MTLGAAVDAAGGTMVCPGMGTIAGVSWGVVAGGATGCVGGVGAGYAASGAVYDAFAGSKKC